MKAKQYYVRKGSEVNGPWTLAQVRYFLLTQGDPNPDYEVREDRRGPWFRASEIPELSSLFVPVSGTLSTTQGASPRGKLKKAKG